MSAPSILQRVLARVRGNSTPGPEDRDALVLEAAQHYRARRMVDAERLCRRVLVADPDHASALHLLGLIALEAGKADAAVDLINQAITRDGGNVDFRASLARATDRRDGPAIQPSPHKIGPRPPPIELHRAAVAQSPEQAMPYVQLATALGMSDRLEDAAICCLRALTLEPASPLAEMTLGNVLLVSGAPQNASHHYRLALAAAPDLVEAQYNLCRAYFEMGHFERAEQLLRHTLALRPAYVEAWISLGLAIRQRNDLATATRLTRRALAIRPNDVNALSHLAARLHRMGAQEEARHCVELCLQAHPDDAQALLQQLMLVLPTIPDGPDHALRALAEFDAAFEQWWRALDRAKVRKATTGAIGRPLPFLLAYRYGNHRDRLSQYGSVVSELLAERWAPPTPHIQRLPERISLAVVSSQVRRHSVWDVLLHGYLAHLDRDRFHISLLHLGAGRDEESRTAETLVDRFYGDSLTFVQALNVVNEIRPDIVFFPEIGMETKTCRLAALRLAPLQATSLGHPITTGLPTIDLYFSGELLESANAQDHYREQLVLLPGTAVHTEPLAFPIEPYIDPSAPNAPDAVNFVLCQNPFKFDPADDDLYPRIAQQAGPCQFWIMYDPRKAEMTDRLIRRLTEAFRGRGLDPQHYLRWMPWLPRGQFLGFLETMDVYLDCPAFSGYTTAWQALRTGIPIVTMEGDFLRQRLAAGLLRQIGRADTIVHSAEDYVAMAVRLASESRRPEDRHARRAAIRAAAPKADNNLAAVRGFEQALVDELGRRCRDIC